MNPAEALAARLAPLWSAPAPSGREEHLRTIVADRWAPLVEHLEVEQLGNLVARVAGAGPRTLVLAHLDEIGWVVRHVDANGFLFLDTAQGRRGAGPEPRHMVGHQVSVLGREGVVAEGVLAAASGHVVTTEQAEKPVGGWDDIFIDIGASSAGEVAERGVYVGSNVVFRNPPRSIGNRIVGAGMDDRICLCVIELLLEAVAGRELTCELFVAATVQEENGLHGARALARARRFDRIIALDVGLVGDIPTVGAKNYECLLGAGPILAHKDALVAYDHDLTWALADCADAVGVPWQHGVFAGYGSDGLAFVEEGMRTALVGVPTRYTHSPFEMIDPHDVDSTAQLLTGFVSVAP